MVKPTRADLVAFLTQLVGVSAIVGDASFSRELNALLPSHAATSIVAVIGLIGTVAAFTLRLFSNPSPPAGTYSVVAPMIKENPPQNVQP